MKSDHRDLIVIGAGPAGQSAAIEAARAGASVTLIDRAPRPGGECVRRGTIPSKALQQIARDLRRLRSSAAELIDEEIVPRLSLECALRRVGAIIAAHEETIAERLQTEGVHYLRGSARFLDRDRLRIEIPGAETHDLSASKFIVATGSRPREVPGYPIDHEWIFDSDSVLSLARLPESMLVVGGGVIGSEYASIFSCLGVRVTLVDRGGRPLGFLDEDLSESFLASFREGGGVFVPDARVASMETDGFSSVRTELEDGRVFTSERSLVTLGRQADVGRLDLGRVGIRLSPRGLVPVDASFRTENEKIFAVGDVIGPPALAASAFEQGRLAARRALELGREAAEGLVPTGIYTVPEIATIGLDRARAEVEEREVITGRVHFGELARGQIAGLQDGYLELIADEKGKKLLGVAVIGEGATDLVHLGQAAILSGWEVDALVKNVFNFPTMGEAYRHAALRILDQRRVALCV
jgi:NAD(P) transhydrogenase